ncbi:patatin-like phospholipase family protein [Candidatus Palauibacter sp.]|uniref:patatin-like phospholipase family protein n=1 Tax=Candidatus Palauibacter sp. TaxID=3101350 RepID=UPI003B51B75D
MHYPFRNLVFEGGGVKGIAYAGALEVLNKEGILDHISRVGGTSAGAITATLIGLGYSPRDIRRLLLRLSFRTFLDDSWGVFRDADRLLHDFGWYKGETFRKWIGDLIARKTGSADSTFADLAHNDKCKDLYFIGTNLSTGLAEVFSFEHTPDLRVADAVRISMSIPFFFRARRNQHDDVLVDGGVLDNYPIKLFDRRTYVDDPTHVREPGYYGKANEDLDTHEHYVYNQQTLGFRLDSREQIAFFRHGAVPPRHTIDDLFDYAGRLVKTLMTFQENQHLHSDDWHRTVYINTLGVGTTDFDLGKDKKKELIAEGKKGTESYLSWYNNAEEAERPHNRPARNGGLKGDASSAGEIR